MMSQMSHIETITQINCTIESHETSHDLDDIMYKIQKSWLPGIGMGKYMKITDLLGNFMHNAFCCSRATQVLMKTLETVNLTEFYPMLDNE